jgi:2OG-Fe(II) oxygenase superfamily
MDVAQGKKSLQKVEVNRYPFAHFIVKNFLNEIELDKVLTDLEVLEESSPTSIFKSNFGEKKEWKKFSGDLVHLSGFLEYLSSADFIESLQEKFNIPKEIKLYPDSTYDGGGYVISPPGSYLGYHADFNFSSQAEKYRVLNVLVYMNKDYQHKNGGVLHLLDPDSKTVEAEVLPEANTLLAFFTDDISFHGVSKNKQDFYRRSFNLYYYADQPISPNQGFDPHKTIWLDTEIHHH